jgi:hypothetical protein
MCSQAIEALKGIGLMNIKIESPFVLEIEIRENGDAEERLQRQVSQWLQRVYGAIPAVHPQPSELRSEAPHKAVRAA